MNLQRRKGRGRTLLAAEYVLFTIAALALGTYAFLQGRSAFYRAYDRWAFEAALAGERPSIEGFLLDRAQRLLSRERAPGSETPRAAASARPPEPPATLEETPPNHEGWSSKRIREYRATLESTGEVPMARLDIPSLEMSAMVFPGTDDWTLNRAVGHVEGSARPGERGNVAIAGHRDSYFRSLGRIARNDPILLTTPAGTYRYRVDRTQIVQPDDTRVLRRSESPTLTLITCYPFYFVGDAPKRFIVQASLDRPVAEAGAVASAEALAAPLQAPEHPAKRARRVVGLHPPRVEDGAGEPAIASREPEPSNAAEARAARPRLAKRIGRGVLGALKKPLGLFRRRASSSG